MGPVPLEAVKFGKEGFDRFANMKHCAHMINKNAFVLQHVGKKNSNVHFTRAGFMIGKPTP